MGAAVPAGEGRPSISSDRCSPPKRGKVVATLAARISGKRVQTPLEPPDELPPIDSGGGIEVGHAAQPVISESNASANPEIEE